MSIVLYLAKRVPSLKMLLYGDCDVVVCFTLRFMFHYEFHLVFQVKLKIIGDINYI
jgi:hypothetical protein